MTWKFALLPILLLAILLIGAAVAVVLLLAHPKTRATTATLLLAFGLVVVLLVGGLFSIRVIGTSTPVQVIGEPEAHVVLDAPSSVTATPGATSPQSEDELSRAVATKTVGVLEAIAGALGRALTEEGEVAVVQEATIEPAVAKPETRPAWVDAPPQSVDDAYQMSITVGPYTTRAECDAKLPEALQEALGRYVDICLGDEPPVGVRLPPDELRDRLIKDRWEETRQYSVGPMTQLHVLLLFDREVKDRVLEQHRRAMVTGRLGATAAWAAIGLILLATVFAYLKVDLATSGAYRGRLRFATATIILALVIVVVAMIA